jgi:hypothetical protein
MTARIRMFGGLLALGFVASLVGSASADDKAVKLTGTYVAKTKRNDMDVVTTFKIKQEGDKITGKMITKFNDNENEAEIKDAEVKDGVLSFNVTFERNGNSVTRKYTGKLEGDTLKLKTEFERNGEKTVREFEAKRESDKA